MTGELIFPASRSPSSVSRLLGGPEPYHTATDQFKFVVFGNPAWDWRTFDLERDVSRARRRQPACSPV